MKQTSLLKKFITCIVAALTADAVLLVLGNGGSQPIIPPVIIFSLVGFVLLWAIIFPFIWQYRKSKINVDSTKVYAWLYGIIRYSVAFDISSFGWKKIFGLQFNVPVSIASQPMNQQSGEWLTWYYWGHSHTLGFIIAILQITGSVMLLFRRTFLLGAVILLALMLNIMSIDIFYQMNAGAKTQSIIMTVGTVFLILIEYKRLVSFFLKEAPTMPSGSVNNKIKNLLRIMVMLTVILFTAYLAQQGK